jgi:FkbM family methyltransferase
MTNRVSVQVIEGPLGPFKIPLKPEYARKNSELLTHQVWAGEYDDPKLPRDGIESVLDIGCCLGSFAVWALAKWPRIKSIMGFDPHQEALEFYKQNVTLGTADCRAVTSQPGPVEFHMYANWGMCSTHYVQNRHGDGYERLVDTVHPKDLPRADLLKIDAEGVEAEIVENYPHMDSLKLLLVEFHEPYMKQAVRVHAERAGLACLKEDASGQGIALWMRP